MLCHIVSSRVDTLLITKIQMSWAGTLRIAQALSLKFTQITKIRWNLMKHPPSVPGAFARL